MTTNPKRPGKSFKNAQCRELRLLRYFQEKIHSGGMHFKEFIGEKGKVVRKVF